MEKKAMLSPHFSLDELTASARHPELEAKNRLEAAVYLAPLQALCAGLLEPVRWKFGPVAILSGFRCPALNQAAGGRPNSQHQAGEAADFYVPSATLDEVFAWIRSERSLRYGEVIREPGWLHISLGEPWREPSKCRQALVFDGKNYKPAS